MSTIITILLDSFISAPCLIHKLSFINFADMASVLSWLLPFHCMPCIESTLSSDEVRLVFMLGQLPLPHALSSMEKWELTPA